MEFLLPFPVSLHSPSSTSTIQLFFGLSFFPCFSWWDLETYINIPGDSNRPFSAELHGWKPRAILLTGNTEVSGATAASPVGVEQCPELLPGVFSSLSVAVLFQGKSEEGKMNGCVNHANTSTPSSGSDSLWKLRARSFISSLRGLQPGQPRGWAQAGQGTLQGLSSHETLFPEK